MPSAHKPAAPRRFRPTITRSVAPTTPELLREIAVALGVSQGAALDQLVRERHQRIAKRAAKASHVAP